MTPSPRDYSGIPIFPEFGAINLAHKKIFDEAFAGVRPENSEFCFGYLFSWRRPLGLAVSRFKNNLLVKGVLGGKPFLFPPIASTAATMPAAAVCAAAALSALTAARRAAACDVIICAGEKLAAALSSEYPGKISTSPRREYFDYVYRARDLAELAGDKYQSKRNFVNRFAKKYHYEYRLLDEKLAARCLDFQKEWLRAKMTPSPASAPSAVSLTAEAEAASELLKNFAALDLCGCAVLVEGAVAAFSVGERLNPDTFVIHAEKADTSFAGAYQTMSRLAAETVLSKGHTYINKEEDLAQIPLRKAKMSYHPVRLIEKYDIRLK